MNSNTVESALQAGHLSASRAESLLTRLLEAIEGAQPQNTAAPHGLPPGLSASAHDLSCRIEAIASRIEGALSLLANPTAPTSLGNQQAGQLVGRAIGNGY